MLKYKIGDILNEEAEALVNTVNCVGVMGRGIALQFKKIFPENFKSYAAACKRNEVQPGKMYIFETGKFTNPRYIINFPTKRHWRGKSRIEDIDSGLIALANEIRRHNIQSIAIPPLGTGLGGLEWAKVRPRIETALQEFDDLEIIIFEPSNLSVDVRGKASKDVPKMTPGRAVLVGLIERYLRGLLDPFVTLLEMHKLMYFMQVAEEPLRLKYTKGPYGPYAENLRHVLNEIEGHLISGYADGGDRPDKQITLVPGALEETLPILKRKSDTFTRFEKVSNLIEGFESPFGLELLSTVHWVIQKEHAQTIDDVVAKTYAWNERKRQFSARQLEIAVDILTERGWIEMNEGLGTS